MKIHKKLFSGIPFICEGTAHIMLEFDLCLKYASCHFKGCRMGLSDKVSLWYVSLLINTRFYIFI